MIPDATVPQQPSTTVDPAPATTSTTATTAATATTTGTETTTTVGGVAAAVVGCEDAEAPFTALCDSIELIEEKFVDPVDLDALAAAAVASIEAEQAEGESGDVVVCAVPDPAFVAVCDAAQVEVSRGGDIELVVDEAIAGMIGELGDPFSAYLSAETMELRDEELTGEVSGIGAFVSAQEETGDDVVACDRISDTCRIVVISTIPESPAEAAGLRPGDVLVSVEGETVAGMTFDESTARVRGREGTQVTIGIERDGETFEVTLERRSIAFPVAVGQMTDPGVGYLRLSVFTDTAPEQFRQALSDLLDEGAETIVLDLRGNPGGSLSAAIDIASEFLADGEVLETDGPTFNNVFEVTGPGVATDPDIELIILLDSGSASASEVVAGALQERGRAVVVGESSVGKNTVQQTFRLPGGGGLKLTIARWLTPERRDYGGTGLSPDVEIELPFDLLPEQLADLALESVAG
jgi:carboxyl-terminal processing protease